MTATRRNLVISPIGEGSVHESWLDQPELRTFDLFLINYSDHADWGRSEADHYVERKGFKYELLDHVLKHHRATLDRYTNIWCPDADIRASTCDVNRLFDLFEKYALQLAQPAIASGEMSYETLRQRPGVVLRYSPYVEVMCPLFTRKALTKVAPTLLESRSGWGLDWVWPRMFAQHEMAILDAVGVEHTGKLWRGENYQKLANLGIDPGAEFESVVAKYGGIDRRLHRKFVRGRIKLPAICETGYRHGLVARLKTRFGWQGEAA